MDVSQFLSEIGTGALTKDDLAEGMHLSYRNAGQLLRDAQALRSSSPGRALSLLVLGIEELGKVILLAEEAIKIAVLGSVPWSEIKQSLTSHRAKQVALANYGQKILSAEKPFYDEELPSGVAPLLDRMKQWGFYVDWTGKAFQSPTDFGAKNEEWIDWLIAVATQRHTSLAPLHGTPEKSRDFVQQGIDFITRMGEFTRTRKPSNEEELGEAIRAFLRENLGKPSQDTGSA